MKATKTATEREFEVRLAHVQLVEVVDDTGPKPLINRRPAVDAKTGAGVQKVIAKTTVKATRNVDALRRAMEWADKQMENRSLLKLNVAFGVDRASGNDLIRIRAATKPAGTFPVDAATEAPAKKAPAKRTPRRRRSPATTRR